MEGLLEELDLVIGDAAGFAVRMTDGLERVIHRSRESASQAKMHRLKPVLRNPDGLPAG